LQTGIYQIHFSADNIANPGNGVVAFLDGVQVHEWVVSKGFSVSGDKLVQVTGPNQTLTFAPANVGITLPPPARLIITRLQ
jgi:hypothetical protein